MTKRKMDRRTFIKGAAAGGVTAVAAAVGANRVFDVGKDKIPAVAFLDTTTPIVEEGGKLTVWVSNAGHLKYWAPRIDTFKAEHPDFNHDFEVLHVSGGIYEKFTAALIAGKGAPDSCNLAEVILSGLFKGGQVRSTLHDLRPYLLQDFPNYNTEFLKWHPYTDVDGSIYGVELGLSSTLYWYRKDLHDAAGVDPATYVTYDDFIKGGKKFNEFHGGEKFSTVADVGGTDTFRLLLTQNGGGFFDADGNAIVDCDENIEAFQLLYDMVNVHKMAWPCQNVWGPEMWAALEDGTSAGALGADWYGGSVLEPNVPSQSGLWAAAAMPAFKEGGAVAAQFGGGGFCITQQSEDPDAVWELIKYFIMSKEGQITKYEHMKMFPTRLDVMDDPRIVDYEDPFYGGQKIGALLAETGPKSVELYAHPFLPEAADLVRGTVPVVMAGEKTPKEALKNAAEELERVMEQG